MNFWTDLFTKKKMVLGLSPMDGVTDAAMRYMTAKYGREEITNHKFPACAGRSNSQMGCGGVDVMFTEFVSVDALHYATGDPTSPSASKGQGRRERLLKTFLRAQDVAPLHGTWPYEVAQVFGHTPEYFAEAAELIESLGFDGIDINMGCPAHKVEEQGSGAGLIRQPKLAQEIIKVVKAHTKLPVSVKTRIGIDDDTAQEWMEVLMEARPAVISLHGRTLKQMYSGSADWEAIARAGEIVHKHGGHILGNGDVKEIQDARRKTLEYGVDGVLIGRAAEGNPAVFNSQIINPPCREAGSQILKLESEKEQRLAWMVEHAKLFEKIFPESFLPVRKHLAWYCKGFPGAVDLRARLMMTNSADEVEKIVEEMN